MDTFFWPEPFRSTFAMELIVCLIHPIPLVIPNKLGVFMFLRLIFVFRLLRDYSELYMKRDIILKSGYIDRGGPPINSALCAKNAVNKNPALAVTIVLLLAFMVFSYTTYIIQREGNDNEGISFFQCFWATVFLLMRGNARFESYDLAGRFLELLVVAIGILVFAFIIGLVTLSMEVKATETFAVSWLTQHDKMNKRKVFSAELIQAYWRYSVLKKKAPEEAGIEVEIYLEDLMYKHKKFRIDCEIAENLSLDPAHDKLMEASRKLDLIESTIKTVEDQANELMDTMDNIKLS